MSSEPAMSHASSTEEGLGDEGLQVDVKQEVVLSQKEQKPAPSTPPTSSPPPTLHIMAASNSEMPPPPVPFKARKRSLKEVDAESEILDEAVAVPGKVAQPTQRSKMADTDINAPTTPDLIIRQSQSLPSSTPSSGISRSPQQTPPSAQNQSLTDTVTLLSKTTKLDTSLKKSSRQTDRKSNGARTDGEAVDDESQNGSLSSTSFDQDLAEEVLHDFDWAGLERSYHEHINKLTSEEAAIMDEFQALSSYFKIWAQVGADKEVDRSFKRFKTQAAYVQHEEGKLDNKRQHYISVVKAFESALKLLGQ